MMLFLSCRKHLLVQLKMCSYFYAIPVYWNSRKNTFCCLESYRRSIYEIVVILHCAHVWFLLCNAVYHKEHNMSTKLIKWNSTMLLVSSAVFHIGSWEKRYDIARLLSALKAFEERHISSSELSGHTYVLLVTWICPTKVFLIWNYSALAILL